VVGFIDPARPSFRLNWAINGNRVYFPIEDRQSPIRVYTVTPQ